VRTRRRVLSAVGVGLFAVFLVSCGSSASPPADESPGQCDADWAAAAAIDDLSDTVQELDPAVRSCATLAAWGAASDAYPAALDGVDPWTFLGNRCDDSAADLASTPLCRELLASCDTQPYASAVFCLTR